MCRTASAVDRCRFPNNVDSIYAPTGDYTRIVYRSSSACAVGPNIIILSGEIDNISEHDIIIQNMIPAVVYIFTIGGGDLEMEVCHRARLL